MEDSKWEDSATQWQSAYKSAKKDHDSILVKLELIRAIVDRADHRCCNCPLTISICEILAKP